ncbi:MAG TPA: hypothetical protein VGL09_09815 [Methylomirabilota bacterium]
MTHENLHTEGALMASTPRWGAGVATLFSEDEVRAALTAARFRIDAVVTRDPYAFEYPSRRIYAAATRL